MVSQAQSLSSEEDHPSTTAYVKKLKQCSFIDTCDCRMCRNQYSVDEELTAEIIATDVIDYFLITNDLNTCDIDFNVGAQDIDKNIQA